MKKVDLDEFLESKGYRFDDLIIGSTVDIRIGDNIKSYDGKDMSYILRKTFYKPMQYLHIIKSRYISLIN